MIQLYGYWRSSASYRVRIALHIKNIDFDYRAVHLVKDGGEQKSAAYAKLNPAQLVPTLVDGDLVLNQSLAIIEYLDSLAGPLLVPQDPKQAAIVRMLAHDMASDLQPITNLRVLQYVTGTQAHVAIVAEQVSAAIMDKQQVITVCIACQLLHRLAKVPQAELTVRVMQ